MTALLADDRDPRSEAHDRIVKLRTHTRPFGSSKRLAATSELRVALHHGWDDEIPPGEGRGSIPWQVPSGAEFDYEQAKGYHHGNARTFGYIEQPWSPSTWREVYDQLTPDELRLADAPWEEHEEWDDLIPMRPTFRPVGGVFEDYADAFVPDERVEALIAEADRMMDANGEPRSGPTAKPKAKKAKKKYGEPSEERKREVARIKARSAARRRARIRQRVADAIVEDVELPPVEPVDPELYGWPEPAPVEIQLREEIVPEPEPETIPKSDYAAAMARVWGAPR